MIRSKNSREYEAALTVFELPDVLNDMFVEWCWHLV